MLVHFKAKKYGNAFCGLRDKTLPVTTDWSKVNCRECLRKKIAERR